MFPVLGAESCRCCCIWGRKWSVTITTYFGIAITTMELIEQQRFSPRVIWEARQKCADGWDPLRSLLSRCWLLILPHTPHADRFLIGCTIAGDLSRQESFSLSSDPRLFEKLAG